MSGVSEQHQAWAAEWIAHVEAVEKAHGMVNHAIAEKAAALEARDRVASKLEGTVSSDTRKRIIPVGDEFVLVSWSGCSCIWIERVK